MEVHYFKLEPHPGHCFYLEVHGGPEKNDHGYIVGINWMSSKPVLYVEHNQGAEQECRGGTWTAHEEGTPISKDEYRARFQKATESNNFKIE